MGLGYGSTNICRPFDSLSARLFDIWLFGFPSSISIHLRLRSYENSATVSGHVSSLRRCTELFPVFIWRDALTGFDFRFSDCPSAFFCPGASADSSEALRFAEPCRGNRGSTAREHGRRSDQHCPTLDSISASKVRGRRQRMGTTS